MTKRDFFVLLIKVIGLYSLIMVLYSALTGILGVIYQFDLMLAIWTLSPIMIVVGLFYLLITNADKVLKILKLEEGFEEDRIDFGGLKSLDIIKFVVLIIGALLVINNFTQFLTEVIYALKSLVPQSQHHDIRDFRDTLINEPTDYTQLIISSINILVGYLMMANYKKISLYLNKKTSDESA